jgi:hypothetical protein
VTPAEVLACLAGLGATATDVASALRSGGHVGTRVSGDRCPVARFLASRGARRPLVDGFCARDFDDLIGRNETSAQLPVAVAEFVDRFDSGEFNDLVEVDQLDLFPSGGA